MEDVLRKTNMIRKGSCEVKVGLADALKGGVIMNVANVEQAKIAERAGAVAIIFDLPFSLELKQENETSNISNIKVLTDIQRSVSIPLIANCRIGHFVEAQILEVLGLNFIDESELCFPVDDEHFINKHKFRVPFINGVANLSEALQRVAEGAAAIRTKISQGAQGQLTETLRQLRHIQHDTRRLSHMNEDELMKASKELNAPYHLVLQLAETQHLPVPLFAAGGIKTPLDAALMMQLGADGVLVDSNIFQSPHSQQYPSNTALKAEALVQAVAHFREPERLAQLL